MGPIKDDHVEDGMDGDVSVKGNYVGGDDDHSDHKDDHEEHTDKIGDGSFFTLIDVQRMMVYIDKEPREKRPIMPDSTTPSMHGP